jgi:hypothetical protein
MFESEYRLNRNICSHLNKLFRGGKDQIVKAQIYHFTKQKIQK